MPDPITALVVGGTQVVSGAMQSNAAGKAADAQGEAADKGIAEQQRQFDAMRQLLQPYVQSGNAALGQLAPYQQAGQQAFGQQQNLIGMGGADAQRQAIEGISSSPQFQALAQQGENAMLQNASATGGLRGGNIQGALAQFRPQMLQQLIDQQYSRLGGIAGAGLGVTQNLASMGQNAAAGVGQAGMNTGNNIAGLYGQQGAAAAGQYLGEGKAMSGILNMPSQFLGMQAGAGGSMGSGFGKIF